MPIHFEVQCTIPAPPQRVYDALTDLDRAGEWMQNLVGIEKLTQGPFAPGTRWREMRRFLGQRTSEIFEVSAADPGRRIEVFCEGKNGTSKVGEYRFTYALEPEGTDTNLKLTADITQLGWMSDLVMRLFSGAYRSTIANELRAMSTYLERTKAEG